MLPHNLVPITKNNNITMYSYYKICFNNKWNKNQLCRRLKRRAETQFLNNSLWKSQIRSRISGTLPGLLPPLPTFFANFNFLCHVIRTKLQLRPLKSNEIFIPVLSVWPQKLKSLIFVMLGHGWICRLPTYYFYHKACHMDDVDQVTDKRRVMWILIFTY